MENKVIIDTGPLVACLNQSDTFYHWVKAKLAYITPPLYTCEAVISESFFLLERAKHGRDKLVQLLTRDIISINFDYAKEQAVVNKLLTRYTKIPISFADACLVRMSEIFNKSKVFTLDSDFKIYRKDNRHVIPTIMPTR